MNDVRLTRVGGPTVLIEVGGRRILTDPTFDAPSESAKEPHHAVRHDH